MRPGFRTASVETVPRTADIASYRQRRVPWHRADRTGGQCPQICGDTAARLRCRARSLGEFGEECPPGVMAEGQHGAVGVLGVSHQDGITDECHLHAVPATAPAAFEPARFALARNRYIRLLDRGVWIRRGSPSARDVHASVAAVVRMITLSDPSSTLSLDCRRSIH